MKNFENEDSKTKEKFENNFKKDEYEEESTCGFSFGMFLGVIFGFAIGQIIINNILFGLAIGIIMGATIGLIYDKIRIKQIKKKSELKKQAEKIQQLKLKHKLTKNNKKDW